MIIRPRISTPDVPETHIAAREEVGGDGFAHTDEPTADQEATLLLVHAEPGTSGTALLAKAPLPSETTPLALDPSELLSFDTAELPNALALAGTHPSIPLPATEGVPPAPMPYVAEPGPTTIDPDVPMPMSDAHSPSDAPRDNERAAQEPSPDAAADARPLVLVVEDNEDTRTLLQRLLKRAYEVHAVGDARAALTAMNAQRFDALVLDINLGGKQTGVDVLKVARSLEGYEDVYAIALTAYALPGDRERFLDEGFNRYVSKPFTRATLMEALREGVPSAS